MIAASACSGNVAGGAFSNQSRRYDRILRARELGARLVLDRPEILADDHRARALALERDDGQEVAARSCGRRRPACGSMPTGIQNSRKSPIT